MLVLSHADLAQVTYVNTFVNYAHTAAQSAAYSAI
jgi:hypothetical protein